MYSFKILVTKNLIRLLLSFVLVIGTVSCKEFIDETDFIKNSHRVKQIIEYDNSGKEIGRDIFSYESERMVLWQYLYNNEGGEMIEYWRITVSYSGDNVNAIKYYSEIDGWEKYTKSSFKIINNLIHEELKSNYGGLECIECWKYNYTYSGSFLMKWTKSIKSGEDKWERCRKGEYIYENDLLTEYKVSVISESCEWMPDYKNIYFYEKDKISGWQGSNYNADGGVVLSQKIEFSYENNKMSTRTYSVWDASTDSWRFFGSLNYYYDENNYLLEDISSFGDRTLYEYEEGHGNASLFYYKAESFAKTEPMLKNAIKEDGDIPFPQRRFSFDK